MSKLLVTPIWCTLPLAEVLKAKPKLWKELGKFPKHMKKDLPLMESNVSSFKNTTTYPKSEPNPLNKAGQYNDGKDANIACLVELNGCKHIAILTSATHITIATKVTWEECEKPILT